MAQRTTGTATTTTVRKEVLRIVRDTFPANPARNARRGETRKNRYCSKVADNTDTAPLASGRLPANSRTWKLPGGLTR